MTKRIVVERPGLRAVVAGGFCAPCGAQELAAQTLAVQESYNTGPAPVGMTPATDVEWTGELGYEGQFTGDGRYIQKGALYFDAAQLPMPLRWAKEDIGAHGGAQVIGLINELEVKDGRVCATGIIDTSTELGHRVVAGLQKGTLKGVSLDLDDMEIEVRVKKELYDEYKATNDESTERVPDITNVEGADYVKVGEYKADDEVMYVTQARVRAATLVDVPAFANAYVMLSGDTVSPSPDTVVAAIVAAAPVRPSKEWFENPRLDGPTPITITDDGRVYGHAALWGTCHTGFQNSCVTPPRSNTNYAWFRTGDLVTDDGSHIPVGKVTMSTGHASTRLAAAPAAAHYDDTGAVAADVAAGEDKYGIWISGALRSNLTDEQVRELRAAPMSGDWRTVGGNLEMVALLAVNLPGFPVPRTRALVASGRTNTLLSPTPGAEEKISAMSRLNKALRKVKIESLAREIQ